MVMIYAGGHISGAHYNPAVTLAVFVRKRISAGDAMMYIGSQLAGALIAALVVSLFKELPESYREMDKTKAFWLNYLETFALAYVVLMWQPPKQMKATVISGWR
jgi:aquaporin Z